MRWSVSLIMKNIISYIDEKYSSEVYTEIDKGIYKYGNNIVTSLCFEQEPELEEGKDSTDISQYPLEDILDKYNVYISDFYNENNAHATPKCCLEFCSSCEKNIRNLRSIIGKHVYCKTIIDDGTEYIELVIE